ncbi:MAG: Unknown protein [uncultured Campylobacterales bacterium]|uniref:Succinylglutamate desuccinylase/Aspartoacylase catalytic domain-containing protein n=1 Tax=uncultured Campylobacterales bacterium TaxID=352960 RepID=A0A6S6TGW5_9BACT|nr:MAG: Unknown protein [uncultured Campylobacterales bacterium]
MKNVAIVAGTHGNEITGVKLLQTYKNNLIQRKNLKIHLEFANLEAIKIHS